MVVVFDGDDDDDGGGGGDDNYWPMTRHTGGEDHYQQNGCAGGPDHDTVDLWGDWTPAWGQNGTYSAFMYSRAAQQVSTAE